MPQDSPTVGKSSKTAEKAKEKRLRLVYNQSLEEHNAKRTEQKNACALCRRPFSQYQAFQDHDHDCCSRHRKDSLNRFCGLCNRGLVCFICNKKYIPAIELMLRDGVDPQRVAQYVIGWQNEIKLKGGYASKESIEKQSRRKQKSVRRGLVPCTKDRATVAVSSKSGGHRTKRWRKC